MATREIKTRIVLEGEQEYKQKIREINKEYNLYKSQLDKIKSAQEGQANTAENLKTKIDALKKVQGALTEKLNVSREACENAKRIQEEYRQKVEAAEEKIRQASKRQSELGEATEETAEEHAKLTEEIKNYQVELEEAGEGQKRASESVMDWETKSNNMQRQLRRLGKELKDNEGYLEEAEKSTDKCATSIDGYGKKVKKATEASEDFGKKSNGAIEALAASMIASGVKKLFSELVEILTSCVEASSEFESAMAKVGTIADTTVVPVGELKEEILKLSGELGVGAEEIAESTYSAISASVDTAESVKFVEQATKLATGGFTDTSTAVDILSTALNAYGLETSKAGQVSDYLITTQNLGKTTVSELAANMGKVIPVAAAYNVEMDNLSSAYAVLTANGIATAESTTYLKSMLNELGDSGSAVSKVLQDRTGSSFSGLMRSGKSLGDVMEILGESVGGDAGKFNELWSSSEAGVGALSLLSAGSSKYNSVLKEMGDSTGAANAAFEQMADTSDFAKKRMETAFTNLKITIGDQLTPALKGVNEAGADLLEWASDFIKEHEGIVPLVAAAASGVGVLTAALAGYAAITKLVIHLVKDFGKALAANPAGMAALAIGTLVAAVGTFIIVSGDAESETDKLIKKTEELKEAVDETIEEYDSQRDQIKSNADAQKALAEELETLISAEGRTEAGKRRIIELVDQLNASIPELALAYDEQTNSVNMTTEAIKGMIDAHQGEEEFNSHLEERAELLKKKTELTEIAEEAEIELAKAEEELQKMYDDGTDCWDASNNLIDDQRFLILDLEEAYGEATQAVADIDDQLKESNAYIEDYIIAQSGLGESTLTARENLLKNAKALGENSEEYAAVREAIVSLDEQYMNHVAEQQERIEAIKEQQAQLSAAYDETYQSTYDNLTGQMGLFQELSTEAERSVEDLISSLDSQISYMETYSANIQEAARLGIDEGLLAKLSDGSEESAKILQAIVDDGGVHIDELNRKFSQVETGKQAFSRQVAEMQTDFKNAWNEMQSELDRNVEAMNKEEEAYRAGLDTVNGYIQGSAAQRSRVIATYESLAAAAISAAKRRLNQHSPSKVFEEIGGNNIEGDIQGAKQKKQKLEDTYTENAKAAITAYEEETKKLSGELEAKRYISYTSATDIQNFYHGELLGMERGNIGGSRDEEGSESREILSLCLSYLPYIKEMAETYGRVYLNPREASKEMAPYLNKDLAALGR